MLQLLLPHKAAVTSLRTCPYLLFWLLRQYLVPNPSITQQEKWLERDYTPKETQLLAGAMKYLEFGFWGSLIKGAFIGRIHWFGAHFCTRSPGDGANLLQGCYRGLEKWWPMLSKIKTPQLSWQTTEKRIRRLGEVGILGWIYCVKSENTEYSFSWESPEEVPFTKATRNIQVRGSQHHQGVQFSITKKYHSPRSPLQPRANLTELGH